jgi:hypothetical protein
MPCLTISIAENLHIAHPEQLEERVIEPQRSESKYWRQETFAFVLSLNMRKAVGRKGKSKLHAYRVEKKVLLQLEVGNYSEHHMDLECNRRSGLSGYNVYRL